jgi:endonuclease YncB( thermonuclease family)
MPAKVVACYDGDTFHAVVELEGTLWKFPCRMAGYDTPEMKPLKTKEGRETEKAKALAAKQALMSKVCSEISIATPLFIKID